MSSPMLLVLSFSFIAFFFFFFNWVLSIYFFLFSLFLVGHGYTEKRLGLLTSAMAAGNLIGAIPAGRFIQKKGLLRALICCFLVAPFIFSVRALVLAFPFQLVLAILAGMVLSLWAVCISPTVAHTTSEQQRPFAFSLVFSLGIGVGALGGLAGSRLPGVPRSSPMKGKPTRSDAEMTGRAASGWFGGRTQTISPV